MIPASESESTFTPLSLASFAAPGPLTSQWLGSLVQLAAKTIDAEGSFLLLNSDGNLILGHPFGSSPGCVPVSAEFAARCNSSAPLTDDPPSMPVVYHQTPDKSLLATIAIRRNDILLGILGVCDHFPGRLSGAQEWALQAITFEVGEKLDDELLNKGATGSAAEVSLLERLHLLELVVVNANDSVLITEAEPFNQPGPIIQYVNPAFTRTTGYTSEDVIGKSPRILQGPLSGREGPDKIRAALEQWKAVEVELLNYRKDGSIFWVELSISPVCDEKGWYTHWISVQRDVTERKRNEETVAMMRVTSLQNEALVEEIRERKLVEAKLSYVAFHDGLTGVYNRSYFMETLQTALKRARTRKSYKAAVLYLDLDGFKAVNDAYGHRVGDLLLTEIAQRLMGCARAQDTVARLGGDEFTLLINDFEKIDDVLEAGRRLRAALQEPVSLLGINVQVTASVGICEVNPTYTEAESILRDADLAMYRAKRQGDVGCVLFHESMHEQVMADLQMKQQLRSAIDNDEFELYYQPLVRIHDRSIYGVEALIRWNHPEQGLLLPGAFIVQAEEMGFIVEIGSWVLRRACGDFSVLQEAAGDDLCLNVNVSSRQLDEPEFLDRLLSAIGDGGIPPHLLQLEITESVFLKDAATVGNLFKTVRALGVKIAFDDFGTGYSSLSYVDRYPIDLLKIDRSFVEHMDRSPLSANIVQMIIRLAQTAGMGVIAEGVETYVQADTLAAYGCANAQGYLYSYPVPLHEILTMLLSGLQFADDLV
jgi:diguanylate cyclase (GGDEF)-like protein/PAS domain S-box-containing protein